MNTVRVGITVHVGEVIAREGKPEWFYQVGTQYARMVAQAGGIPLLLPTDAAAAAPPAQMVDAIDALLVSGGGGLPGQYFRDNPDPTLTDPHPVRDHRAVALVPGASGG